MDRTQKQRLAESKRRSTRSKENYKKFLQKRPLNEVQAEIMKELHMRPLQGERNIYVKSGKPIRGVLGRLMDAGYIKKNKNRKYYLTDDGYRKTRSAEIGIARIARNLEKKKKKEMRETLKKWKKSLPKLEKRNEESIKKIQKIYNSVNPKTKKAVRNNKFIWKGHSKWIDFKDDEGVRKLKIAEALGKKKNKLSNKIYRRKGAIKRVEDKLKGKKEKPVSWELPIDKELRILAERNRAKLYEK